MTQSELSVTSFGRLLKELAAQIKTFFREEVQLAKTEVSEKIAHARKNATNLAIGGLVAYGGLMVLLVGLGMLLAFLFQKLGWEPLFAAFVGLAAVGLLVMIVGGIFVMVGIKAFSKESLAPERTLETLHKLKGEEAPVAAMLKEDKPKDDRSSEQIEQTVLETENQLGETLEELGKRVTFVNFRTKAKKEVHTHPYRWGLVAMGTGFLGSFFLKRRFLPSR